MNVATKGRTAGLADLPFRLVVSSIKDREVFLLGPDGCIASWNDGAAEMTGYTAAEVVNRPLAVLYAPGSQQSGQWEQVLHTAETQGLARHEGWCLRREGSPFHAETEVTPIRDETEVLRGFVVIVRDMTHWHSTQAKLQESEERFRTMADCAPVLLWMTDTEGRCTFFNDGWLRFTGKRLDEELGYGWAEGVHPEDLQPCMHHYLRSFVSRTSFKMEYRLRRADGEYRWILDQGRPRQASDGSFQGFIGSCIDITDQKRLQRRFQDAVESAPSAMLMVNATGNIVLVNAHAETLFGYAREELLGIPLESLVPQRFRDAHKRSREKFLKSPARRAMGEGRDLFALCKDGREVPVEIGLNPIDTEEGPMVMAAIVDITERKKREERIRGFNVELEHQVSDRTAELRAKNAELESFTYSVSHDLRTPLRAIDGYSAMLEKQLATQMDPETQRLIGTIRENVHRMGNLIDDLLALSRLGQRAVTRGLVDMNTLMKEGIAQVMQNTVTQPRIVTHNLPLVWGDRSLLMQVVTNLLSNAVKFSGIREEPVIHISGMESAREAQYSISDNGAGFDMRHYDKLFNVFTRLHHADEFAGTGVGLAIVYRIISMHGGRVWATGKVDEGATFSFALPRRQDHG